MSIVRRFTDYFPEPRDHPWTEVRIREAASALGPWVDAADIDVLDYNPEGEYVTELAMLPDGWYQLVFVDSTTDYQPTEPVQVPPAWAPSLRDVADLSPGFTRTTIALGGRRQNTFTDDTDPTATEVRGYIVTAVDEVKSRYGLPVRPADFDLARTAAKWHAAATVESEHGSPSDDADGAFRWKQSSYVATLNELIARRPRALRLS